MHWATACWPHKPRRKKPTIATPGMGQHKVRRSINAMYFIAYSAYWISARALKHYKSSPCTAWNKACRAWAMIWPFQASVSV